MLQALNLEAIVVKLNITVVAQVGIMEALWMWLRNKKALITLLGMRGTKMQGVWKRMQHY